MKAGSESDFLTDRKDLKRYIKGYQARDISKAHFGLETTYSISAPVVVMSGAENYGYSQHMMKITARRMAEAGEIHQKKRATDLEVFFYLQSATLLAPPDETMMKAIEYLCRKERIKRRRTLRHFQAGT